MIFMFPPKHAKWIGDRFFISAFLKSSDDGPSGQSVESEEKHFSALKSAQTDAKVGRYDKISGNL